MRDCYKGCDPETDEEGIECDGEFVSEECVVLKQNTYFNIVVGDRLSSLITKIVLKFKTVFQTMETKIPKDLPTYADDTEASADGLDIGEPYKTPDGFVKIRVS